MTIRDPEVDEQLVARALALLRVVVERNEDVAELDQVPRAVGTVQRELRSADHVGEFSGSLLAMRVQYSLRDGWRLAGLSDLISLAMTMRWVELLPGGIVHVKRRGVDAAKAVPLTPRERLALARALAPAGGPVETWHSVG